MKFEDVLPALRAGKKIKIENIPGKYHKDISRGCELSIDLILSSDFEIVKEKIKKTVWVNVFQGEYWFVTNGIFESEETAVIAAHRSGVKHIGTYPITIEVEE
jgi:hypothetical protein